MRRRRTIAAAGAVVALAGAGVIAARVTHFWPFGAHHTAIVWACDPSVANACPGLPPRESAGPRQCGWGGFDLISFRESLYARNPPPTLGGNRFDYEARASLPTDAARTGWRSGQRELWVSPADAMRAFRPPVYSHVYIRGPHGVERLPWFPFGCA